TEAICQPTSAAGTARRTRTRRSAGALRGAPAGRAGRASTAEATPLQRRCGPTSGAAMRYRLRTGGRANHHRGVLMSRRLEPEDLYAIKIVEDPQISPH